MKSDLLNAYQYRSVEQATIEKLIENEAKRLTEQYGRPFINTEEIKQLTGANKENVYALLRSEGFPVVRIGKSKAVSILGFVTWQMKAMLEG